MGEKVFLCVIIRSWVCWKSQKTAIFNKSTNKSVSISLPEALIHNTNLIAKPLWNHTICLLTLIPNQMLHMQRRFKVKLIVLNYSLYECGLCVGSLCGLWLLLFSAPSFLRLLLPLNHKSSLCVCLGWFSWIFKPLLLVQCLVWFHSRFENVVNSCRGFKVKNTRWMKEMRAIIYRFSFKWFCVSTFLPRQKTSNEKLWRMTIKILKIIKNVDFLNPN